MTNPPTNETKMVASAPKEKSEKLVSMQVHRSVRVNGETTHNGVIKVTEEIAKELERKFDGPVDSNGNKTFIQRATRL